MGLMKELNALNDIYQGMYESKKADKDYDGDGKIESGTAEYLGSKDKAIKKAMKKEAYVTEISANKLIDAAKAAEVKRGKAAVAGDRETAKKALSQNKKFYDAAKAKRKNEEVEISPELTKLIESGKFSEQEINLLVWNEIDEGLLVKAAQGVEKVGGAVVRGAKSANRAIDKADKAVTKATMNRVVKPAAKAVGKGVKKVAAATARGAAGAVAGAVKGAAKGIKKGMKENRQASYESREYSHNPEKYHDSEGHDKKLERDKPYRKRSRAARMADPDRGINSPAFKKFMADRGM